MKVLHIIAEVSHRDKWETRLGNDRIHQDLNVDSVEKVCLATPTKMAWSCPIYEQFMITKRLLNDSVDGSRDRDRPQRHYLDSVKSGLNMRGYDWNTAYTQEVDLNRVK